MYTDADRANLKGRLILNMFVRSGEPNLAQMKYAEQHGFDYVVVSMDKQELADDVKHLGLLHVIVEDEDWKKAMDTVIQQYGEPAVIISHSPCTYNSNINKGNHRRDGGMTDYEYERLELKEYWIKECCLKLLKMKVPAVIVENPQGYMDKVITYKKGEKAYVEVHPWMFAPMENPDVPPLR